MTFSEKINDLFVHEKWAEARALLEERLEGDPNNHWLITRIGTTYYEQRNYVQALELSEEAYKLSPRCFLVLWDLASAYEMLERDADAARIYGEIFQLAVNGNGEKDHSEGTQWLQSLLTDCFYSAAGCLYRLGRQDKAAWFIQQHFKWRAVGFKSIYSLKEARQRMREIASSQATTMFKEGLEEAGQILSTVS